jgi:hypothetical protein
MISQTEWFLANRYMGPRQLGERVTGVFQGVRWVGSLGNDRVVSELEGPMVTITLDLPFRVNHQTYNILVIKSQEAHALVQIK